MNLFKLCRVALVAALLSGVVAVSEVSAGKGGANRPFKGSGVGVVVDTIDPNGLVIDWEGKATHLGKFTRREWVFLNEDGSFIGFMVFVAANGDELTLDFEGAFITATDAIGTYTFTGGTGRFEDATGEANFHAFTADFINATVTFEGAISY